MTLFKYLKHYWHRLIGENEDFSLESKVFHIFSIVALFAAILELIINFYLGFYGSVIICLAILLFHTVVFLLSRKWHKFNLAIIISGIECNVFLGIDYFINGGINSPTLLLFLSTLFLMCMISNSKYVKFWILFNLLSVLIVGLIEYQFPNSILINYTSRSDVFFDNLSTYIICAILLSSGLSYIKKSYQLQNEKLAINTELLYKMNSEKDKLFSIISHDLKSPLNAVKQYLEFLATGELKNEERAFIEKELLQATASTQSLLENLLEWSKNQIDGIKLVLESSDLVEAIDTTIQQAEILCKRKGINFSLEIPEQVVCLLNKHMIQLIVRNLLNNAVKFTPSGGNIILGIHQENQHVILSVKDNGVGISQEKKPEIFSLNIKSTFGTNREKGTGLGLILCKEYVEKLNGEITFESELNKGTTFYVKLLKQKKPTLRTEILQN